MKIRRHTRALTLIEIMIVMAIFGIVIMIAVNTWMRQRELGRGVVCQENLQKIDGSKEMYALNRNAPKQSLVDWDDIVEPNRMGYLKKEPACPGGGEYNLNRIGEDPTCSYNGQELFLGNNYKHMIDPTGED